MSCIYLTSQSSADEKELWSDEDQDDEYWDTPLIQLIKQKRAFEKKARSVRTPWLQEPIVRQETPQERGLIENSDEGLPGGPLVFWDTYPLSEGYAYDVVGSTPEERSKRFDHFVDACVNAMTSHPPEHQCHSKTLYVSNQICRSPAETPDFLEAMKFEIKCPLCGNTPDELVIVETSCPEFGCE